MSDQPIPIGNARTRKAGSGTEPEPASVPNPERNLYQRLLAITAEVGRVAATSKTASTAGGKKAIGIEDVEEALGPLMAAHGVFTEWREGGPPERIVLPAKEGTYDVWRVHMRVRLVNADNPELCTEWADWWDIGSNPTAGSSFARKKAYKAYFHLAAAEDEGKPAVRDSDGGSAARPRKVLIEPGCPDCGDTLAILYRDGKNPFIGHAEWKPGADMCKWKPDYPTQTQWIRDAEAATAATEMMGAPMTEDGPPADADGPLTLVELIQTAARRILEFAKLDAEACQTIMSHHGWDGKAKSTDWLRSFTETGPLVSLVSDLNSAIRDCPNEIPV